MGSALSAAIALAAVVIAFVEAPFPAAPAPTPVSAVVVAAGDIACDPAYPDFNEGAGTGKGCHQKATSDLIGRIAPTAVLVLGDVQYVHGDAHNYDVSYDPTWGRYKAISHPTIGNHEGGEGGSNKSYFAYFGENAGDPALGYYSYDIGPWHMISLNSNCGGYSFNRSSDGCRAGSAQEDWLRRDLAAHPAMCTLAYFHVPRFASGSDHHSDARSDRTLTAIWEDLYAGGADVVLNGHAHEYERFAPLRPDGMVDPQRGIREFVVGTGGDDHHAFGAVVPGSEVRNNDSFGVLQLTLHPASYDWSFTDDGSAGATNRDSGTGTCHR